MEAASADTTNQPNPAVIAVLERLLRQKFPDQQYHYELQHATNKGDNYVSVVFRVLVHFVAEGASSTPNFSLILKVPPSNAVQRRQFFARSAFLKEALAYDEFLPLVKHFQASKGIAVETCGFHEYAECYATQTEEFDEAVFLEDLSLKQFKLFDRFSELDCAHVSSVLRGYAKLHAVSFALQDQQPKKLAKFKTIVDIFEERKNETNLVDYVESLKKTTLESLDAVKDTHYVDRLKQYFATSFFDLFLPLVHGDLCEPYAVVCHGDCWNNNMMFREENGQVIDMRLIDWQVMRYSSPFVDLMYYFFTCTSREFRTAHFKEMLEIYYSELIAHIQRLGSPAELFPRRAFDKEMQSKGAIGLLMAMIALPIVTVKGEDVPDLAELSERAEAGKIEGEGAAWLIRSNKLVFNKRMRDVVIDCIDYGFI